MTRSHTSLFIGFGLFLAYYGLLLLPSSSITILSPLLCLSSPPQHPYFYFLFAHSSSILSIAITIYNYITWVKYIDPTNTNITRPIPYLSPLLERKKSRDSFQLCFCYFWGMCFLGLRYCSWLTVNYTPTTTSTAPFHNACMQRCKLLNLARQLVVIINL